MQVLDFIEQPAGILAVCDLEYDVASTSLQTAFQDILHKDDEIKSQSLERYGKAVGYLIQIVNNLAVSRPSLQTGVSKLLLDAIDLYSFPGASFCMLAGSS